MTRIEGHVILSLMVMHALRSLGLVTPAILLYSVAIPLLARGLDRRLALECPLPDDLRPLAVLLLAVGGALASWSAYLLTFPGQGTPNPLKPPANLVVRGPYRWSRNPLMLGAWIFGLGLALALRSVTLTGMYLVIAVIGIIYVRKVEEPRMLKRFGEAYRSYAARVPRWLLTAVLLISALPASAMAQTGGSSSALQPAALPTVVAKIKFERGAQARWIEAFERHIAPAILEAIEAGDEIIDVTYFESVVPGQDYDFLLVFRAKSFDFYDRRRPFPHYAALFRRVGEDEGRRIVAEMAQWEKSVTVTLLRSYRLGQ